MSALLVVRDRRVLMVRARGRDALYLPGGKVESGETAVAAAVREAREETALRLTPADCTAFGTVTEDAHDQPAGTRVAMALFLADTAALDGQEPVPSAEVTHATASTSADADRCPPAGVATLRRLVAAGLLD